MIQKWVLRGGRGRVGVGGEGSVGRMGVGLGGRGPEVVGWGLGGSHPRYL